MTDGASVDVVGDTRLAATLHDAADDISKMDLTSVANRIARDASGRAPRRTGRLAGSIRPSYHGGIYTTVGSDVPYAGVQEYGWPRRGIRAQPFLRPALAVNTPAAVAECQKDAQHALNNVKGA